MKTIHTKTVNEFMRRRRGLQKIISGIIMLVVSVPVFVLYYDFPSINTQLGPHQVSSWLAVTLSFFGFIAIIMGAGELDL